MPKAPLTPDRLFDRMWRPGRPFHPRVSSLRRIAMALFFTLLCAVIAGYVYITDETRVKHMAESYLGSLVGGPVKIGRAKLSIFQGLQLDDVELYGGDPNKPDSLLFSAHSFLIEYSLRALLARNIEATRIVAVEPRVHVTEDADTGRRNYSRLLERHRPSSVPSARNGKPIVLPEVLLRSAQLIYTRLRDGQVVESNSLGVEGQLTPMLSSRLYTFSFQSRGANASVGAMVSGNMDMDSGKVTAKLTNFAFGADVKTMLPPDVRQWWEEHGLAGRVNIPLLSFTPSPGPGLPSGYRVEIEPQGVTLLVRPQEWLSSDQQKVLDDVHRDFQALRDCAATSNGFVDSISALVEPVPLALTQVHGRFVFTDDQRIAIDGLRGWLEEVPFKIDGTIKGYSAAAQAKIHIASSDQQDVEIPAAPGYLSALPPVVRELYDRFQPRGSCRFWVDLDRVAAGARPKIDGEIDILDGHFLFERFPYPLDHVSGKIMLGHDSKTGDDVLTLQNLVGHGPRDGVNANGQFSIEGTMSPLGSDTHVDIKTRGHNVRSEPQLIAAFAPVTRTALGMFKGIAPGTAADFGGDFECRIIRQRGEESHWTFDTDLHLDHASGRFSGFPYPIDTASGDLKIRDDHVVLENFELHHGTTVADLAGTVWWSTSAQIAAGARPGVREDLKLKAHDVAIDGDLLAALPAGRRSWLEKLGATGTIGVDGKIAGPTSGGDVGLDLNIKLSNATFWPVDGTPTLARVSGNLHLDDQRLTLRDMRGKRGKAPVTGRGEISWPNDQPTVTLEAEAKDLELDPPLYSLLPPPAQGGWNQVHPEGTADVSFNYSGVLGATLPGGFELTVTPKQLSATPAAAPYRLDALAGLLKVTGSRVELTDVTARHGDAKIQIAGVGSLGGEAAGSSWQFKLAGQDVLIDADLRNAMPAALADFTKSLKLSGKMDFSFSNLAVTVPAPTTKPGEKNDPDVDFAVNLRTAGTTVDAGVPLDAVHGSVDANGTARHGRLSTLGGQLNLDSFTVGGHQVTQARAELLKSADRDQLTIGRLQADIAHGSLAGQIDYSFPQHGLSRYAVNLVLQNANIKEITGDSEQPIDGQLSASLALEGVYNRINSRRGRGDVSVAGQQMYKIPLLLGLLQVTNLSLPLNAPFTEASARYGIEGNRVTFEAIELRSRELEMQGSGNLDFGNKQVRLTFVTDSSAWLKIPLLGPVIEGARHELLQIHVRGTIQEPTVSAGSMQTLTTTIDQVINGDGNPIKPKK